MGDATVAHDLATLIEPADMEQLFYGGQSFVVTGEDGHELFPSVPGLADDTFGCSVLDGSICEITIGTATTRGTFCYL